MLDLHTVKDDFSSLVIQVQPWTLAQFIMWLDLKVAEYKVNGYMDLDDCSEKVFSNKYNGVIPRSNSCRCHNHLSKETHKTKMLPHQPLGRLKHPRLEDQRKLDENNLKSKAESAFCLRNSNSIVTEYEEDSAMDLILQENDSNIANKNINKFHMGMEQEVNISGSQKHKHPFDIDVLSCTPQHKHPLERNISLSSSEPLCPKLLSDTENSSSNHDLFSSPKETVHVKTEPVFGSPYSAILSSEAVDYSNVVGQSRYTGISVNEQSNESAALYLQHDNKTSPGKPRKHQTQQPSDTSYTTFLSTATPQQNRLSQGACSSDSNDTYDIVSSGDIQDGRSNSQKGQATEPFSSFNDINKKLQGMTYQKNNKKDIENLNQDHSFDSACVYKEEDSNSRSTIRPNAEFLQFPSCNCNITLPTFSDPLVSQMLTLGITHRCVLSKVLNQCAEHMLSHGFLHKHDYQRFSEMFYNEYPAIGVSRSGFQYPWSVFAKSLSQKIRTTRWKIKKMEAVLSKCENSKTEITEDGDMYLEVDSRTEGQTGIE